MNRFRVIERIGSGGMGTVYRAFDERLQRHVAVKEIAGGDADRVLREAQAAARLNHPGIVTLYEIGGTQERVILVSELVNGATLGDLADRGEISDRDLADFGADVCGALAHAHERGVIHRDIKPQNIIVRADDGSGRRAKLADFGIARVTDAPTLTAAGEVVGTLAYMAPEQAEGERAEEPSDVYSLALTLYEGWAGRNPVVRDTPAATARVIGSELPSLREFRPDLPASLTDLIDACLDPDPRIRPGLAHLHRELEDVGAWLDDAAVPSRRRRSHSRESSGLAAYAAATGATLAACLALAYLAGPGGHAAVAGTMALLAGLGAALVRLGRVAGYPAAVCAIGAALMWGGDAAWAPVLLASSALTFRWVLRAGHVATGLFGALLWSAALGGFLQATGAAGAAGPIQLVAVLAAATVLVEWRGRMGVPRTRARQRPAASPRTA